MKKTIIGPDFEVRRRLYSSELFEFLSTCSHNFSLLDYLELLGEKEPHTIVRPNDEHEIETVVKCLEIVKAIMTFDGDGALSARYHEYITNGMFIRSNNALARKFMSIIFEDPCSYGKFLVDTFKEDESRIIEHLTDIINCEAEDPYLQKLRSIVSERSQQNYNIALIKALAKHSYLREIYMQSIGKNGAELFAVKYAPALEFIKEEYKASAREDQLEEEPDSSIEAGQPILRNNTNV